MCGRFSLTLKATDIQPLLQDIFTDLMSSSPFDHQPRFNIAPSQHVWAVIFDGVHYRLGRLSWGLLPSFAQDEKVAFQMINAKTETIFEKPSFSKAILQSRCLILADGYYEWKDEYGVKIPHHITLKQHPLFAFAGIYTKNTIIRKEPIFSTAILTRSSEGVMQSIHERVPILLKPDRWTSYLTAGDEKTKIQSFFDHLSNEAFEFQKVSTFVNKPSHEGPQCLDAYESNTLF